MERYRKIWVMVAILAGIVTLSATSSSEAAMRMRIQDLVTGKGVVITDDGPGDTLSPQIGAISYGGTVGIFAVTVTTGTSKPLLGGIINYAELDLNNVTISTGAAGTLVIWLEDDTYTGGPDGLEVLRSGVGGVLTAGAGSSITLDSWVNPANLVPTLGADTGAIPIVIGGAPAAPGGSVDAWQPSFTSGPGPFSGSSDAGWVKAGSYSLFARAIITFGAGGGSVSFNDNQQVLPAPGGLVLALTALPGFGLAWLRRRFKKAA